MRTVLIILLIGFISSCAEVEKKEKPEDIWSEDRFVDVMVEVQLTESYIRLGFNRSNVSYRNQDSLYNSTFRKVGVDAEDFRKNFTYYSSDPKKMEKIYQVVIERLSEKQAELHVSEPIHEDEFE